ncbi:MAG: DUF1501 domain-containing protein [Candidatus Melainabacteria bacterium]|nr:DUF1501 domain-containing protein [Candidatus Melainabacteria bacterium]
MSVSRRNFIASGLGIVACCLAPTHLLTVSTRAATLAPRQSTHSRILVVVQLNGGNDGLNCVIPYNLRQYYQSRPGLAIKPGEILPLTKHIGLNPNLTGFANLYKDEKLAIVQGVGYPNPNRSHFRSMEIWQTAEPNKIADSSWLGRYLDLAVATGTTANNNVYDLSYMRYPRNLEERNTTYSLSTAFGARLKFISQMIASNVDARIYNICLDGFDTHANQSPTHSNLLKQLGDGLLAFQRDLQSHGVDRNVLIYVFSEFGRRLQENSEGGTDHGTAAPVFIIGSSVKGGLYGEHPSLTQLDEGDLCYKIDFRTVYTTLLDRWLLSDSYQVLGANFGHLAFL